MVTYDLTIAQKICDDISSALFLSVKDICEQPGYPNVRTVYEWLRKYPEFEAMYDRAREAQALILAEQIIELIDEEPARVANKNGEMVIDPAWVTNQKNRVDTRKWLAGKLLPKKYGDATILRGDKENPIEFNDATKLVLETLTVEQLEQIRLKALESENAG